MRTTMRGWAAVLCAGLGWTGAAGAQAPDWQQDWQRTIQAAKQEGDLWICAPGGQAWHSQLMAFQALYPEIKLTIATLVSRDFWPRVEKEREVGKYLWDLKIGGTDAPSYKLKVAGQMDPIRPLLVLPEVRDDSKWLGGIDGLFLDKEKQYFLAFAAYASDSIYYNRRFIPDGEAPTIKELVDPRWKGKISLADPRGGASLIVLGIMDMAYGDAYLGTLLGAQQMVVTKEPRQQMDWMAFGRYPIAFGVPTAAVVEYTARGVEMADYRTVGGLPVWSQGIGGFQMPSHAPHPNATKLLINWLLTRDVQAALMPAIKLNSRRLDVAPGAPDRALTVATFGDYVSSQSEELQPYQQRALQLTRELLK